ncbi:hypothetical protein L3Q67_08050 [Saccharothrix sp. AJ9571]|nr:hypothetical protein L3Q67_08050 [Saccharothrix sp. AJ9571]
MNSPLNAAQIYEQINGGPGTTWLVAAQESASNLTSNLSERAQQIANLAQKIQAGWTGEAGANAANAALPLAKASIADAELLAEAGTALESQTSAFGTVQHRVVPVPPTKPELTSADVFDAVTTGNWDGYNNKVGEWQAKSQQNIDAFAGYHATSMGNGDTMPSSFTPLVDPGAPIGLAEHTATPTGGAPGGSQPNTTAGNVPGGSHPGNVSPIPQQQQAPQQKQQQPAPAGQSPSPVGQSPTDGTKAAAYNPPVAPKAPPSGGTPNPYSPPPGSNPWSPPPGFPANPGGRPGTGVPNSGGLYNGGRPGSLGGPGGTPGTPGTPGNPPGRSVGGVPTGGAPTGGAPVRGGTGPAGMAGKPGGPGGVPFGPAGAGGAQRGEEDKEHRRPDYLFGPDPDKLFGGDTEKPTPPVIGETRKPS